MRREDLDKGFDFGSFLFFLHKGEDCGYKYSELYFRMMA